MDLFYVINLPLFFLSYHFHPPASSYSLIPVSTPLFLLHFLLPGSVQCISCHVRRCWLDLYFRWRWRERTTWSATAWLALTSAAKPHCYTLTVLYRWVFDTQEPPETIAATASSGGVNTWLIMSGLLPPPSPLWWNHLVWKSSSSRPTETNDHLPFSPLPEPKWI